MNGAEKSNLQLNLNMLPGGMFKIITVKDDPESAAKAVIKKMNIDKKQKFTLLLQPGGGFVAILNPITVIASK